MYNEHLKIQPTKKNGNGVFTLAAIPANVPILEISGDLFSSKDNIGDDHLQVGIDNYIGPTGGIADYINHSCNANCVLDISCNRAVLYSLFPIKENTEITFDYSMSSTDTHEMWKMECKCGEFGCRKIISGYNYLSLDLKEKYEKNGMTPKFMINKIFIKNI